MDRPTKHKSLVSDIPHQELDNSAETLSELAKATGRGRDWLREFAMQQINAGRWEKVFKRVNNRTVIAYRRVK